MAPNLKNIALLTDSLSSEIDVFKTKYALPTTTVYQQQQAAKAEESASYWDWPSEEPAEEVLSLDRIESNLVKAGAALSEESSTNVESDDYWAEASASPRHHPAHTDIPSNYWDEQVHESEESDQYWDMPAAETLSESDKYWSWSHDKASDSDKYWGAVVSQQQ